MVGSRQTIVDTAAIVAFLQPRDHWHGLAARLFSELPKPFVTCESVLSESCHLLENLVNGREQVVRLVGSGVIRLGFTLSSEIGRVEELMKKYADVPMSLADACLVRMSELATESSIFTFDGDFQIYRRHGRERIPLIGLDMF